MNKRILFILFLFLFCRQSFSQNSITVAGRVSDESDQSLPFVKVYIENSLYGAMTDENGVLKFSAQFEAGAVLIASMVGYATERINLKKPESAKTLEINITLSPVTVALDQVVVLGSAFSSEREKGIVINSMDVVMTPGGAADIYQSLKTMPGLTSVSESAELYVRGGDPTETVTMIDQASIYHPYTYESSYGGLFSNLNTDAVDGMYFSSGGFSSKYGNVLSGVLDISTKNEPLSQNFDVGISMAAAQFNAEIPLAGDELGIRIYSMRSFTEPIMWMNGELDEFTSTPESGNITAILSGKYSKTGRLKFTGIFASDKQGVKVERAEFNGAFNGNSSTSFYNLQLSDVLFSSTVLKTSLSFSSFNNHWKFGIMDLNRYDKSYKWRADFETTFTKNLKIDYGIELENRNDHYIGKLPADNYDVRPEAKYTALDAEITGRRNGAYLEFTLNKFLPVNGLHFIGGIRTDNFPRLNITTLDPRAGLVYEINKFSTLRFAWGIFHQLPEARLFTQADGNPALTSMRADHFVLSYDYKSEKNNFLRIELFDKRYKNLPLADEEENYTSEGFGFARGIDFVWKGEFPFDLDGWFSYGFINTKRKWMEFEQLTSSSFDVSHNISVVLKYQFSAMWHVGINLKYATGRPYTPVLRGE